MNETFFMKLKNGCLPFGVEINEKQAKQLYRYMELLVEWNEKINLTAITDEDGVVYKHFVDSLTVYPLVCELLKKKTVSGSTKGRIIDVGTGAGFPGIPLAIIDSDLEIVLLDSLAKRVNYLQDVIAELGLTNVTAIHFRAEDAAKMPEYRECFDIAIARAVAAMPLLAEYCVPFVKIGGYFVAMKGGDVCQECKDGKYALDVLGCAEPKIKEIAIGEISAERSFVFSEKKKATNIKYPRKAGMPAKKPLK